ncbi:MAG TPA: hypothetical protein VEA18_02570, partial [Candidatus Kapabacteria bacterium]|nr:hypothetical protein [Candidatus Kapabacteria bacterium]
SSVIGIPLPKETVVDILTRLGFSVKGKKDQFSVTVPSWRATKDIAIPEDIAEEVARIYGYNAVPSALPTVSMQPPVQDPEHRIIETARTVLAMEHGLTEVYNYSFVSPEWLSRIGIDTRHHIELENPIAADRPLLRRRLLSNLFENVESNLHRFDSVRMFEVGHVYRMEEKGECIQAKSEEHLPGQALVVGMVVAEKNNSTPFFDMSSALHTLMRRLRCPYVLQKNTPEVTYVHPSRSATIHVQDMVVGYIGELHPATALKLGIESRVAFCEINMSAIVPFCHLKNPTSYVPLLLYPSVRRDLAFIVPVSVTHEKIHDTLRSADPLITQVELFDVYQGKHVGEGKKSMAYHITYQATDRTLSTEEVDAIQEHITLLLQKEFSATIRG